VSCSRSASSNTNTYLTGAPGAMLLALAIHRGNTNTHLMSAPGAMPRMLVALLVVLGSIALPVLVRE